MGKLYLVPTPIGNLKDITLRALEVLQSADCILAEDTRTSGKLLKHYEISKPVLSHHMHNEHRTVSQLVQRMQNGETLALDRKSTRLNSSHVAISYAVFCLKK